jgi:mannose/fructose/N-acetylgalactosamine-specific phosphotransferase system component IID
MRPVAAGLRPGLRWRLFLAALGLQGSWNPQRMQNLGLLAVMVRWLRGCPRDTDRDRLFCRRYYEFFNTNPYLANFLVGGLLRLEQDREDGLALTTDQVRMVRDSLGRSLASIGDQLFWLGLRPALVMAASLMGLFGWIWGALGLFAAFAVGQLLLRWLTLERGFRQGMDVVDDLADRRWHLAIAWTTRAGKVLTGAVAGCYLMLLNDLGSEGGGGLLLVGAAVGMGLPLVCRRRPPGEVLVLLGLGLAIALAFAIPETRS